MSDPITTLAVATGGAFLGKFVGPAAEAIGKAAWEQAQQLGAKATAYLAAVGREPQPVEPKLLLPLVQAASLETDPTLADKWAALLANAADPAKRVVVQPSFTEVLRQLAPMDAAILAHLYQRVRYNETDALFYELPAIITQGMAVGLAITDKEFAVSIDTLLRLRLAALPTPRPRDFRGIAAGTPAAARQVCPTILGFEFLAAATPPTP